MKTNQKRLLLKKGAAICLIAVMLTGCGEKAVEEVTDVDILVEAQTPDIGNLTISTEFIGTISPQQEVFVIPLVAGEVTETHFKVGDTVNAGDLLFKIDDEAARMQLASAKAQYNSAEAQVNQQLGSGYEGNILSAQTQLANSKLNLDSYNRQYSDAKDNVEDVDDDIHDLKDDIDSYKKKLKKLKNSTAELKKGYEQLNALYQAYLDALATQDQATIDKAKQDMLEGGNYSTIEEFYAAYIQFKSDYENVQGNIQKLEDAISAMESGKDSAKSGQTQLETARDGYLDAVKGAQLAVSAAQASYDLVTGRAWREAHAVAEATMATAQIGIDSANMQLDYYKVTAPISGVVEAININPHDMASQGSPAYVISNKETMQVTFYVTEDVMKNLKTGEQISVDRNGEVYPAVVTEISTTVSQQTGLFEIKANINVGSEKLFSGTSVKISLVAEQVDQTMLIPFDAVYYSNGEPYVYCIVNGTAKQTFIETGLYDEKNIEIVSGLTKEDKVITSWSPSLSDGVAVYTGEDKKETADPKAEKSADSKKEKDAEGKTEKTEADKGSEETGNNTSKSESDNKAKTAQDNKNIKPETAE